MIGESAPAPLAVSSAERRLQRIECALFRCPPETLEAGCLYARTGLPHLVPVIVRGVLFRLLPPREAARWTSPAQLPNQASFAQDLGLDSLTVLEFAFTIEEVFEVEIPDDGLRRIRTVDDVSQFLSQSLTTQDQPDRPAELAG